MRAESSSAQSVETKQMPDDGDADATETGDTDYLEVDEFEPPTELDDSFFIKVIAKI